MPLNVLDHWDISYTTVLQEPGCLDVTALGANHEGWDGGWNVAEAISSSNGASA